MRNLLFLFIVIPLAVKTQQISKRNQLIITKKNDCKITSGIKWVENLSWEQIKNKAKAEDKLIFIDAYATWCLPCKKMDQDVFSDKEVGSFLNAQFVSVKVQMDETENDNEKVKSWYSDARYIKNVYKPDGYPCFLFLSPDGILVHRGIGLQTPEKFIELAKEALKDPIRQYEEEIENFKRGRLEFSFFPALARLAKKNKDKFLANAIAKEFKEKYLDRLPDREAFTKDNLVFIAEFSSTILTTKDKYFSFFFQHEKEADSIMNYISGGKRQNVAARVVVGVIKKEEIYEKLYKNGKAIKSFRPQWKVIYETIKSKYGNSYAEKYFPDAQINFYFSSSDWRNYSKYVNKKLKMFPPIKGSHLLGGPFDDSWMLNDYAWNLFKYCDKKKYLKRGLVWVNLAIKLKMQEKGDSSIIIPYLDTKANLLYRMGQKYEAINLERKCISLLPTKDFMNNEFNGVIEKMKKDIPTWPTKE